MLFPPMAVLSRPLAANVTSRISSACKRNRDWRANSLLSGSRSSRSLRSIDDCRYVADVTINLCMNLTSQCLSINSTASQSSSAGCVGLSPRVPKSSEVVTNPREKNCCHIRLTATRAVSGLSRDVSQRASDSRVGILAGVGSDGKKEGASGCTARPGCR